MGRLSNLIDEWAARREGRKHVHSDVGAAARDIAGVLGHGTSGTWDFVESSSAGYLDSLDPRLPASLHISERDRLRANRPIPVSERCIEDWPKKRR